MGEPPISSYKRQNEGTIVITIGLKQATYALGMTRVAFVYAVTELGVIFSGTERGDKTTANTATEIVRMICESEGFGWEDHKFFDIQTWLSFPGMRPGEFRFTELAIRSGGHDFFRASGWSKLEGEELEEAITKIPSEIWDTFTKLIS